MSAELELVPPADRPLEDPRRLAYRMVANLVERHLREYEGVQGELRVQLERIEAAMRSASSVDPK